MLIIPTKNNGNFINEQIRANEVMLIGPNGEQLGLKTKKDALTLAEYSGFDLVLMSENANPAVCKIMDYNKYQYEKKRKLKESQKKQRESNLEVKEFRLSVTIDAGDFNTRLANAKKYLGKGHKVKISIRFKGRQITHSELGKKVLERFFNEIEEEATMEVRPKFEGRSMFMLLAPKK